MIEILMLLIVTCLGSLEVTNRLHDYANKKYLEGYKKITKDNNISYAALEKRFYAEMQENIEDLGILYYIPLLNLLYPIVRIIGRKDYLQKVAKNPQQYFPELVPKYLIEQDTTGVVDESDKNDYFVGYFDEKERPITIYFRYDGTELALLTCSAPSFCERPSEECYEKLLSILYDILIGNDKGYIKCHNIYRVFNQSLVNTLYDRFEDGTVTYHFVDTVDKELQRTREKPKK